MIVYNVPTNVQRMTIGVQGENNVREFRFDVTEWRQLTGNIGTAEMVVQRAGDESPYAAVITMHDASTVSWVPTSTDTAKAGAGKLQLMWLVSGQTVKTKIFDMKVDRSLDYAVPDSSLDPWAAWMPDIINAAAKVIDFGDGVAEAVGDWLEEHLEPTEPPVDNTLSIEGAAADAKATGDKITEYNNAFLADAGHLRRITAGTDYDTLTTAGCYECLSTVDAREMINGPVAAAHRLYVIKPYSGSTYTIQLAIAYDSTIYKRYLSSVGNSEWRYMLTSVRQTINVNERDLLDIPRNTDYDTMTSEGCYECRSSTLAKSMGNCPTKSAHRLFVTYGYTGSSFVNQIVVVFAGSLYIYSRQKRRTVANAAWSEWRSQSQIMTPVYNQLNHTICGNVSKSTTRGYAVAETLPYENQTAGVETYYDLDSPVDGVIYSSVWRDGLDVFRNLTLETYYSALANPYSVLYTKSYTEYGVSNAHSYYGGVCSTYVTRMLGLPYYRPTASIGELLTPKSMASIRDIALGDILLTSGSGHIAFISQILVDDNGGIAGVMVSEEDVPIFKTTKIRIDNLESYIKRHGYRVMTYPDATYPEFDDPSFNSEIIFEWGNNTYRTSREITDEKAWCYIPNATSVSYRIDGGAWSGYMPLTGFVQKVIDSEPVPVYDLSSLFIGNGIYDFRVSDDDIKLCTIRVVSTGTIEAAANGDRGILTLSGWSGCTPVAYYILEVTHRDTEVQKRTFDGLPYYSCQYYGAGAQITLPDPDDTSITIVIPPEMLDFGTRSPDHWKVWVEFDTGSGLKQAFSNYVPDDIP